MTVTVTSSSMSDLPHALRDGQQFARHLDGGQPAVFLDYDETLTPIVDRPEDAVISESMRDAAGWLTERTIIWWSAAGIDHSSPSGWALNAWCWPVATASTSGITRSGRSHDAAVGFE
ncbi:MAG: hypothetical protein M3302_06095, partial [Actinomycetota bacterium]|nr:hypothetical protein [Actinomycetota bacterium]